MKNGFHDGYLLVSKVNGRIDYSRVITASRMIGARDTVNHCKVANNRHQLQFLTKGNVMTEKKVPTPKKVDESKTKLTKHTKEVKAMLKDKLGENVHLPKRKS